MAGFKELEDRLNVLKQSNAVEQIIFGRLGDINNDAKNEYPLLLFVPISSIGTEARKKNNTESYTIDFYICDLEQQQDLETRSEVWDRINRLLKKMLQDVETAEIKLLNDWSATYGYEQNNDRLIIVKRTANIEIFDCIT